jgi:Mrp family chromosome partitioning ATPase
MSKYFQALQRGESRTVARHSVPTEILPFLEEPSTPVKPLIAVPVADAGYGDLITDLARDPALCQLSEQLAALSAPGNPVRVLIGGCRPGDGASSIAAALALDLSQRLALRTVLVDGHLRHPALGSLLARSAPSPAELSCAAMPAAQRTAWPRLELIARLPMQTESARAALDDLNGLLSRYPVAVIDLGVIRLEPRMLMLARPDDPVLLVTRYEHTERVELQRTVTALRGTNRRVPGVILNGYKSPVPRFIRRLLGIGG